MARPKPTDLEREKTALKSQLARCRRDGAEALNGLGNALDLPRQLRDSFRTSGWKWIAGALAAGAAVSLLVFRRSPVKNGGGSSKRALAPFLIAPVAKSLFSLLKPMLSGFARKQFKRFFKKELD
ncbi:MAG: hypothetical protein ACI8UO_000937 [Verrucomicrobiales bacterium]|jgi:hypothetical protein